MSTRAGAATERARKRRSSNGNSSPMDASTWPRQSPSDSFSIGNSSLAVAPPSRSIVRSRSCFWSPASMWRRTGHLATGSGDALNTSVVIEADSPGRTVFGEILTDVTATFLGNERPTSCKWTSASAGKSIDLPAIEPRTLEVRQDMQLLDGFPRADQDVGCPGHRGDVIRAAGRRLDRGGTQLGRPREWVNRSVERAGFQLRVLTGSRNDRTHLRQSLLDGPCTALKSHAGRAVEQHDDQASPGAVSVASM